MLGEIFFVGSGPGDVGLLTLDALSVLRHAEVVLADRIIPERFLRAAVPSSALLFVSRKTKGNQEGGQAELDAKGLAALRRGKRVVRLKEGDPFVYGRGGEELLFYRRHGFHARVLPGISSCLAAPLSAGIPVTHRGVANEVLVGTGLLREGAESKLPPYSATRTTVLLMAVARLPELSAALEAAGYPRELPAAIVEKATHGGAAERVFRGSVLSLGAMAAAHAVRSPACLVLGHTVNVLEDGKRLIDQQTAATGEEGANVQAQMNSMVEAVTLAPEKELDADTRASMLLGSF